MSGDGSIYRRTRTRPSGEVYVRWIAQVSFGGRSDRRIVRRVTRTRADAKKALAELLAPTVPMSQQPLGDYLRSWLDERTPNLAQNTVRGYRATIPHWGPIAGIPLSELTAEDIAVTLANMRLGPKTSRNALGMLRTALTWAERREYVRRNVAQYVERPRLPRRDHDAMTPERARAVLDAVKGKRYAAAVALGLCGLRIAEALGLAWDDVATDSITIRHQLAGSGKRGRLVPTKTTGSAAVVQLPAFAVRALRAHEAAQKAERIAAGIPTEAGLVFVTRRGLPVHQGEVNDQLHAALEKAGLPKMRFHDLRHGAASLLASMGVHPSVAQAVLRHSTPGMTLGTYTHVTSGLQREAMDAMDRVVGE